MDALLTLLSKATCSESPMVITIELFIIALGALHFAKVFLRVVLVLINEVINECIDLARVSVKLTRTAKYVSTLRRKKHKALD